MGARKTPAEEGRRKMTRSTLGWEDDRRRGDEW